MSLRGTFRTLAAATRRIEREQHRKHRALLERQKSAAKLAVAQRAELDHRIRCHLRNGKAGSRLQNENVGRRQRDAHRDCGWKFDDDHRGQFRNPDQYQSRWRGRRFSVKVDPGLLPFLKTIKGKGVSVLGEVRIAAVSSQGVQPQIAFSLNYRFK